MDAGIGESPVLSDGLALNARTKIVKGIGAGVIVILVPPNETAQCKYRGRVDDMGPRRSDVKGLDLLALIRRTQGISRNRIDDEGISCIAIGARAAGMKLLIERIRILKPGTRVEIQLEGVVAC